MRLLLDGAGAVIELVHFGFALGEVLLMTIGEAGYWASLVQTRTALDEID